MKKITLKSENTSIKGFVKLSGSKSISNRVLIIKSLSENIFSIKNLSNSDDTLRLEKALKKIETCRNSSIPLIVDANNAGTVLRFLTAFLSYGDGKWLLTGNSRMKERPISDLVDALEELGADITYASKEGFPPLKICSTKLRGGEISIDTSKSSQFVTALMLIAPLLQQGLKINLEKKTVSQPYIKMTASIMKKFGINLKYSKNCINIFPSEYKVSDYFVESDWSSASYWYELVALCDNSEIKISSLFNDSIQGDAIICDVFSKLGVSTEFLSDGKILLKNISKHENEMEFDATNCPDLVPAIMVSCFAKGIKLSLKGYHHLKYKESDRIQAMLTELSKIGLVHNYQG
ncbi:MAG: 3-phosphoshikimate 1-carboxyvinyltransferase, partial [Marinilabiliales bacterium]